MTEGIMLGIIYLILAMLLGYEASAFLIEKEEQNGVSNMLTAAAMTYVASVINTILQLLRMLLIILDRDRRE